MGKTADVLDSTNKIHLDKLNRKNTFQFGRKKTGVAIVMEKVVGS